MVYFGLHGPFQPGLEQKIVDTAKRLAAVAAAPVSAGGRRPGPGPPGGASRRCFSPGRVRGGLWRVPFAAGLFRRPEGRFGRDWARRRQEILDCWHGLMGAWPPVFVRPEVELFNPSAARTSSNTRSASGICPAR